jgi:hypothetical protein
MSQITPLDNDPLEMLRSELASVAPSAEFAVRVRERLAEEPVELTELRSELADVTASPEFAARVRERIETSGPRWSWSSLSWRWLVPASAVAAAALLAVVWMRPAPQPIPREIARVTPAQPYSGAGSSVVTPAPPVRPAQAVSSVARSTSSPVPERRDPFLEVITDQPALFRDLWVQVTPGVSVGAAETAENYQAPRLEVVPIDVHPIAVFVVPDPRSSIGVLPFILRIAADSAERSSR